MYKRFIPVSERLPSKEGIYSTLVETNGKLIEEDVMFANGQWMVYYYQGVYQLNVVYWVEHDE